MCVRMRVCVLVSFGKAYCSQEREESFFQNVQHRGQKERDCQEDEQLVGELAPVVLGDELAAQLNGPGHGLELLVGLQHRSGGRG